MGVCDSHEALFMSSRELNGNEGYLLDADFMQSSIVMKRTVDMTMAMYGTSGMTRQQCKDHLVMIQGKTPWMICEQCVNRLGLSESDKVAARDAAIQWYQNNSQAGYCPLPKKKTWRFWER